MIHIARYEIHDKYNFKRHGLNLTQCGIETDKKNCIEGVFNDNIKSDCILCLNIYYEFILGLIEYGNENLNKNLSAELYTEKINDRISFLIKKELYRNNFEEIING